MKIVSILGTRPEITKLSPVLPLFDKEFDHKLIHTGQHYDYNMDQVFFEQLQLRAPDYKLSVGAANLSHAKQTAKMMVEVEDILAVEKPNWVLVFADTNTPVAGALVASKMNIPLIHMEAGCRSFNKLMPEEINRIVCDHCADLLLAPDEVARKNLLREGLSEKIIHVVGSTAIEAAHRNAIIAEKTTSVLSDLELSSKKYALLTIHRAENTNDPRVLNEMISGVGEIAERIPVVFPIHPRTKKIIEKEKIAVSSKIRLTDPFDYMNFLTLIKNAQFVMSDSGGIQEEAAALSTPCFVLRNETEWTYLLDLGKNALIGTSREDIVRKISALMSETGRIEKMASLPLTHTKDAARKTAAQKTIEVIKNVTK